MTTLSDIIQLFESRHTEQLSDRHAESIIHLCKHYQSTGKSLYYHELKEIEHILGLIHKSLVSGKIELFEPLLDFLKLCGEPFKKKKSSDETEFVGNLPDFLNALCPFLKCDELQNVEIDIPLLVASVATLISRFASYQVQEIKNQDKAEIEGGFYGSKLSPLILLYTQGNRNLRGLHRSDIPETLVDVLAASDHFSEHMVYIIEAIANCSLYRPISHKFANTGVVKDLVQILSESESTQSRQVLACMEAIWNILEVGGKEIVDAMALEEVALGLKKIFEKVIREGFKLEDKWLRNELCILINYTLNSSLSHKFFLSRDSEKESTFFEILLKYASHDELILQGEYEREEKLLFTSKEEDTEFKKLLWTSISSLIKEETRAQVELSVIESKFVIALLFYFNTDQSILAAHRWQAPQLRDMQLHALSVISNIIIVMPDIFRQVEGQKVLIRFLSQFSDTERRLACTKAILNAAGNQFFKKEFAEEGIMDILMDVIQNRKDNSLELREYAFNKKKLEQTIITLRVSCERGVITKPPARLNNLHKNDMHLIYFRSYVIISVQIKKNLDAKEE